MAKQFGLPTAEKKDSQGICFIGEIDIRDFLKKYIPVEKGLVRTTSGREVGEHDGLAFYTIGQRQGIGIGGGIPYYVVDKEAATNTLVVAQGPFDPALFARSVEVVDMHWIFGTEPRLPITCSARIRYRQALEEMTLERKANGVVRASFKNLQRAATPGQSIVFYHDGEMLGGGCISRVDMA